MTANKVQHEDSSLLECDTVPLHKKFPTFQRITVPSSGSSRLVGLPGPED